MKNKQVKKSEPRRIKKSAQALLIFLFISLAITIGVLLGFLTKAS